MKDIFKNTISKVAAVVLIIALIGSGGYWAAKHFLAKKTNVVREKESIDIVKVLEERLEATAELNTADYICTYVEQYTNKKDIKGWKIPLTEKNFTISYEGTVKAGIKDLTKAKIEERGKKVIVKLPRVEITGHEINKETLKVYDETHNILNQISVADVNKAQKNLEKEMVERAERYGLLDKAKDNAETIVTAMLSGIDGEYSLAIEWQE